jgi:hypothetical protein
MAIFVDYNNSYYGRWLGEGIKVGLVTPWCFYLYLIYTFGLDTLDSPGLNVKHIPSFVSFKCKTFPNI